MYGNNFIVALKVDGRILRETGEFITLPFGAEYSILLKNKDSRTAVVNIEIDGRDVLDGAQLIIDANSEIELEGFKKNDVVTNRFKFIKRTTGCRSDRIDDGFIRVEVTYEKEIKRRCDLYPICGYYINDVFYSKYATICGGNNCLTKSFMCSSNPEDIGITVKGSNNVTQKFISGYVRGLEKCSNVIIIRLRGEINSEEMTCPKHRSVCNTCGKKSKKLAKCGTYL